MRIFLLLFFLSFSSFSIGLTDAIRDTFNKNENKSRLLEIKDKLIKIEYFFNSSKIKNHHLIFQTEFLNYSLKNPIIQDFGRFSLKKENLEKEISLIDEKIRNLSPAPLLLASQILTELKFLKQQKVFNEYLERIRNSYYFTSPELKLIDKKMKFLEPWWKFYLQYSIKDIEENFIDHLTQFIIHFSDSTEFLLNAKIEVNEVKKLKIFQLKENQSNEMAIEDKLNEIIDKAKESTKTEGSLSASLTIDQKQWAPKDSTEDQLDKFKNLNAPINYPKPSPNYIAPQELPIPVNDW